MYIFSTCSVVLHTNEGCNTILKLPLPLVPQNQCSISSKYIQCYLPYELMTITSVLHIHSLRTVLPRTLMVSRETLSFPLAVSLTVLRCVFIALSTPDAIDNQYRLISKLWVANNTNISSRKKGISINNSVHTASMPLHQWSSHYLNSSIHNRGRIFLTEAYILSSSWRYYYHFNNTIHSTQ